MSISDTSGLAEDRDEPSSGGLPPTSLPKLECGPDDQPKPDGTTNQRNPHLSVNPHLLDKLDADYEYNLNPFDAEPFFYRRMYRANVSVLRIFLITLIIPLVLFVVAAAQGTLFTPKTGASVAKDFFSWLFIHQYSRPLNSQSAYIPLLRDYPDLIILVSFVLSVPIVYFLYQELSVIYGALHTNSCLFIIDQDGFVREHAAIKDAYSEWGHHKYRNLAAAFLLAISIYAMLNIGSAFDYWAPPQLRGPALSAWQASAAKHWWAALVPFHVGSLCFVIVGAIALYSFGTETYIGWRWLRFLNKTSPMLAYRANPSNPDGQFGWLRIRNMILWTFFGSLPLSALVAFGLFRISRPTIGLAGASIVFLIVLGDVSIVVIQIALSIRRNIEKVKRHDILQLQAKLNLLETGQDIDLEMHEHLAGVAQIEKLSSLPKLPLGLPTVILSLVVVLVPILAAIADIINAIKS